MHRRLVLAKLNSKKENFMGSTADKIKGATNEAIGKAKQGIGEAIGSDRCRAKARFRKSRARARRPSATPRKPPRMP